MDVTGRRDALDAAGTIKKLNKHRVLVQLFIFCARSDKTRILFVVGYDFLCVPFLFAVHRELFDVVWLVTVFESYANNGMDKSINVSAYSVFDRSQTLRVLILAN